MRAGQLLGRVVLEFEEPGVREALSAAVRLGGHLWVAADEEGHLDRLSPGRRHRYAEHARFAVADFVDVPEGDEIDIEGIDADGDYLWVTGSHSPVRRKPKNGDASRLAEIHHDASRFVLARIPVVNGELVASVSPTADDGLRAAALRPSHAPGTVSALVEMLRDDPHLGPFLTPHPADETVPLLAAKDNGFDVEGLAVRGRHVILGLRGPVLHGHAVLLEMVLDDEGGWLVPRDREKKGLYRKWFLDLDGLGVRELDWYGDDLLVLAGPTMRIDGPSRLYRLRDPLDLEANAVVVQGEGLERLFDVPWGEGCDHAEGLALCSWFDDDDAVVVVYDKPAPERLVGERGVIADVFGL